MSETSTDSAAPGTPESGSPKDEQPSSRLALWRKIGVAVGTVVAGGSIVFFRHRLWAFPLARIVGLPLLAILILTIINIAKRKAHWTFSQKVQAIALGTAIVALYVSPALASLHLSSEYVLLFCAGLTNVVALEEITTIWSDEKTRTPESRMVQKVLVIQLLILTAILGYDLAVLLKGWTPLRALLAVLLPFVALMAAWEIGRVVWTMAFTIAVFAMPAIFDMVRTSVGRFPPFVESRFPSWIHLLFVPLLYLVCDLYLARWKRGHRLSPLATEHLKGTEKSIALDWVMLGCGVAFAIFGFAYSEEFKSAAFEAGASSGVLILGNAYYLAHVKELTWNRPGTIT